MKPISEKAGIRRLAAIRDEFRREVSAFEANARSCSTCTTPGACCVDEHFVNVRISRLEAAAINERLNELPYEAADRVFSRAEDIVRRSSLESIPEATFACPLYERGVGCLVHDTAKPLPCIIHACYDRREDLPPDELLSERELKIDRLNRRVYRQNLPLLPIPVAICAVRKPA